METGIPFDGLKTSSLSELRLWLLMGRSQLAGLLLAVAQGLVLGPVLFNMVILSANQMILSNLFWLNLYVTMISEVVNIEGAKLQIQSPVSPGSMVRIQQNVLI